MNDSFECMFFEFIFKKYNYICLVTTALD